jgi:hypothetical protein
MFSIQYFQNRNSIVNVSILVYYIYQTKYDPTPGVLYSFLKIGWDCGKINDECAPPLNSLK